MKLFSFIKICTFISLIYITLGDAFLPQPHSDNSKEIRENINNYIVELLPTQKIDNFQKTLPTMETVEKATSGSKNSPL